MRGASGRGGAAIGCIWLGLSGALPGCVALPPAEPAGLRVYSAPPPSAEERYCAWYGARHGDRLYFGEAAFWSAMRGAGGEPEADLHHAGPQRVGRFDLASETLLEPLDVAAAQPGAARSGTWDVWADAHTLWFTTFFERSGTVDLATGHVRALELGRALNEWAAGPGATLLVTRYGSGELDGRGDGEVLAVDRSGRVRMRWALEAPPGYRVAPKTPAWDPRRSELHVTTDLLPSGGLDAPVRYDYYVLGAQGELLHRNDQPEVQFVARGPNDRFFGAEVRGRELWLVVEAGPDGSRRLLLDSEFPREFDFVQDIQAADDGRVVLTRWSGRVHVLQPDGELRSAQLPRLDPDGLYYTAVLHGDRLCATYCADVTIVCIDAP